MVHCAAGCSVTLQWIREALTLNPRYTQARCWYGLFFLQWGVGRDQDGLAEAWLAFENDPLSAYATTVLS
jgi:hypothetical protein